MPTEKQAGINAGRFGIFVFQETVDKSRLRCIAHTKRSETHHIAEFAVNIRNKPYLRVVVKACSALPIIAYYPFKWLFLA